MLFLILQGALWLRFKDNLYAVEEIKAAKMFSNYVSGKNPDYGRSWWTCDYVSYYLFFKVYR